MITGDSESETMAPFLQASELRLIGCEKKRGVNIDGSGVTVTDRSIYE